MAQGTSLSSGAARKSATRPRVERGSVSTPTPQYQPLHSITVPTHRPKNLERTDKPLARHRIDPSVHQWADLDARFLSQRPAAVLQDTLLQVVEGAALDTPASLFWAYHSTRFSFFTIQGIASVLLFQLNSLAQESSTQGRATGLSDSWVDEPGKNPTFDGMMEASSSVLSTWLAESCHTWLQDWAWIQHGVYKEPWDMVTPNKQFNPAYVASRAAQFMAESSATLHALRAKKVEPVWLQSRSIYPQYYNTFHYQTDGWLSDWSASIYEHSTETLFQGRQDAMQRCALVPISEYVRASSIPPSNMRLLEVAAGTGRFHTFIKDNWPDMRSMCSDLSPFYLQRARENVKEWKRLRQPNKWFGGSEHTGVDFMQMAAERVDATDASLDIVVSVYLFHELPEAVRRKAVAEWFRVLKPGGLCVLADSLQKGDRPGHVVKNALEQFGDFNEPYYRNYVSCDLGAMFQEAGFVPGTKYLNSFTKTLSFTKPLA